MWYESRRGVRFQCTGCGACCKRPGVVEFTPLDILRISQYLEMSQEEFTQTYLSLNTDGWIVNVEDEQPCLFLDDNQCTIHDVKPEQCRSYPFWPEIIKTRYTWKAEGAYCEGIDEGKKWSVLEIQESMLGSK